jgi:TPR repeat protein
MAVPFYKKAMPLHRHRHWLITACLLILSLIPAGAKDEFTPEEIKTFQEQKIAAEKGDSSAQLQLGHCYYNGWGVTRNEAEAEKWYAMSSEQGNVTAKFYLKTLRERAKAEEIDAATKRQASTQDLKSARERLRDLGIPNEYQPRAENHGINSALRTKPARVLVAWVILIPVILTVIIFVFFWNIYVRSRLEESLQDDVRFNSRFQPHSRHHPAPGISILWLVTGIVIVITGLFIFISLQGIGAVLGVLLIIGGACMVVYNSYQGAGEQNQGPEDRLLEVQFQKDRVRLLYSITGQRELVFGPDLRVWIGTRENYLGGITILGELYARVFTGIDIYATFKDAVGKVELELDFPGTAEFIALCRHHGAEINLSLNLDAHVAARLAATASWQPNWQPDDLSQASEADHSSAKPKLWNPKAAALLGFLLFPAVAYWVHAANWRELGKHDKARRSIGWLYGYLATAIAYIFILPYFLITPEILDFTWTTIFFTIWYFASGRGQIRYFRESNVIYEKKGWLKPILATSAIIAAWIGILFCSDEFFQATLRADAYRGDVPAQRSLAWMYANGEGVSEDQEEASRLYRKAAEQGDRDAQLQMGFRQREGKGMLKSDAEAFKWFRLAANQGDRIAEYMMGTCYLYGFGIPKDYAESVRWHRKSAENGNADSQKQLGNFYYNGIAVKKDLVESLKWYRMAADQGDAEGQYIVGLNHAAGSGTEKNAAEALKWYLRAASQDYPDALYQLAESYAEGKGATKDINEAIKWYKKSAERGNISAQIILGNRYSEGIGVTRDRNEASKWYRKAAEQGSAYAQVKIGLAHESGDGVDQNQPEAVKWFRKAADQGDKFGQLGLGIHLISGYGVKNDVPAGLALIRKSASNGNPYALYTLGGYHVAGLHGLSKDLVEGYAYLSLAAPETAVARNLLAQIEKDMGPVAVASGKQRAQSLKKEIDEQIAARKAGK